MKYPVEIIHPWGEVSTGFFLIFSLEDFIEQMVFHKCPPIFIFLVFGNHIHIRKIVHGKYCT